MYLEYWGLKKHPFLNVADPEFFYPSGMHEEALQRLLYSVEFNKGAALLLGEIGCGKTLVSHALMSILRRNNHMIACITNPLLSPSELLREILYQLKLDPHVGPIGNKQKLDLLHLLTSELHDKLKKGTSTVVIVDECHLVLRERNVLEELRLLLNLQVKDRFLLTLIMIGQPELQRVIAKERAFTQRIAIHYFLNPLSPAETSEYVLFRLKKAGAERDLFTDEARQKVYDLTKGIPRVINTVCDLSLLAGYTNRAAEIDHRAVETAAETTILDFWPHDGKQVAAP